MPIIYQKMENDGVNSLSNIELRRVRDWETARIYRMQGQHYQYQQGYLDESSFTDLVRGARAILPIWNSLGIDISTFDPEFIATIQN